MKFLATAMPLQAAVDKLAGKTPILSALRTAEWAEMQVELRANAFFSAGVEDAKFISMGQSKLLSALSLRKEQVVNPTTGKQGVAYVDRSSFIGDMRKYAQDAGLGTGTGGLTDLSSRKRLGLIYDMQTQGATNYGRRKMDLRPAILDAYPAYELVRHSDRLQKRDWPGIWTGRVPKSNGELVSPPGRLVDGRMIALKTDPIWVNLSVFGMPWPPFDFGSGMGLDDVSRRDAEDYGLIRPDAVLTPEDTGFNDNLFADAKDLAPAFLDALKMIFGDQIQIDAGTISWTGAAHA